MHHFTKRRNSDGTMDSICLNCFRTIATCTDRLELIELEKDHRCQPGAAVVLRSKSSTVLAFPPDRMIECHSRLRRQLSSADRLPKIETARERVHLRKMSACAPKKLTAPLLLS